MKVPKMLRFGIPMCFLSLVASIANAKAPDPWLGKRVFVKDGAVAKDEKKVVDNQLLFFRTTVEDVDGDWLLLGRVWVQKDDVIIADQAIDYYTEKIQQDISDASRWYRRSRILHEKGMLDNAIYDSSVAIQLAPAYASAYASRAAAWREKGELDKAHKDFTEATRLDPSQVLFQYPRGQDQREMTELDRAFKDLTEAIRLNPTNANLYNLRGIVWMQYNKFDSAIKDYTEAIRLNPKSVMAHNNIAWLYATCPEDKVRDGKKAVALATEACEMSHWKTWRPVSTLAAAYAESRIWDKAISYQEQAIEMAADEEDMEDGRSHLRLYKGQNPHREALRVFK